MHLSKQELSRLTDQELLDKTKQVKSFAIINATLIGLMAGIIVYSVVKNTLGLVTLIPLFFIYKFVNRSKENKEIAQLLKDRGLK
ncbi:FUSC family protein [Formosa sp. L2A11]|uniref:FUSC family protein n=1 Tax=Formosa sp. L2A11 TaxID=2686363 RepID=UPI001E5FE224|nr:FUSC family protein [Formosa sp. L2A11]